MNENIKTSHGVILKKYIVANCEAAYIRRLNLGRGKSMSLKYAPTRSDLWGIRSTHRPT
ncbi:hypothetical protein NITMOv2_4270 [Nitrospira moscoviensis]|uniref:Uncharacterized protein n=1 Tax=Nitrospira moscoviensis TaxID=42253 RepID=A0A0K2GJ35_NITMO|nr:hypothetical protein NITMOv2_4270 [Nitrospira moscoviensis]